MEGVTFHRGILLHRSGQAFAQISDGHAKCASQDARHNILRRAVPDFAADVWQMDHILEL